MPKVLSFEDLCVHIQQDIEKGTIKLFDDGYWINMRSYSGKYDQSSIIHYCYRCGKQIWFEGD